MFALSLITAVLTGFLAISCLRWRRATAPRSLLWVGSLATGLGLGLSSVVFYLWISLVGASRRAFPLVELGLLVILMGVALEVRRHTGARTPAKSRHGAVSARWWLSLPLWFGLVCAVAAFAAHSATNPQGGWDAWMTWNMHARAIVRGGDHWRELLAGLPAWSHSDYPLLVPGSVARIWTYMGRETPLAPVSLALLFTFATAGLLYASVALLRSPTQGALAVLVLLGTKFFVLHGASQYADVPFGFFMLATFSLLALGQTWPEDRPRLVMLAGVAAGLSTWTKNEGLLLLPAVLAGYGLVAIRAGGWRAALRDARAFGLGLLPMLVIVASFKLTVTSANDLMADQGAHQTLGRLLEVRRYVQVLTGLGRGILEVSGQGLLGLLLLGYWFCGGRAPAGPWRTGARATALALALVLAGYVAVLLTAPPPLLETNVRSINRLLLQLWPSALLAYFLLVRTAEEAGLAGRPSRPQEPAPALESLSSTSA